MDPDEDNLMQPHAGVVFSWDFSTGERVYIIQEGEKEFFMALEEELSPIKMGN